MTDAAEVPCTVAVDHDYRGGVALNRQAAFRQEKSNSGALRFFIVLLLIMIVGLEINVGRQQQRSNELEQQRIALEKELEAEEAYTKELDRYKVYTRTKKYKEEAARERLGLVYSDEIVFKPEE